MLTHRMPSRVVLFIATVGMTSLGCAELNGAAPSPARQSPSIQVRSLPADKVDLFRKAETARAEALTLEVERLQTDLRKAEEALIEAESGLAENHTRADAVSSLAVARIQVERAASRSPWRRASVEAARAKLREAERQVAEGRFGAALFFVYRAQRLAESLLDEAALVETNGNARMIRARRVNLRAGPSLDSPILTVLDAGTPVFPRTRQGDWVLIQVSSGPTGWVHQSLAGTLLAEPESSPAAPHP